jgi:catechol 2,3-dioxygenase-like lactoylglutathione lyase family enzyme|tara:strand:+ start:866 stop:1249 length:384 start_codon:yes stop_codon:yes gene_type:complete
MRVTKISAVTLLISDMKKSVDFYSKIPNFKIVYGGSDSQFTSFLMDDTVKSYLNLKLNKTHSTDFGRIIFYVEDVDKFFIYMQNDETISVLGKLESKPQDAEWGERFFHVLDPDGYRLSFAAPIGDE